MSEQFDFNGNLDPDDDLIIDAETLEVTKGDELNRSDAYGNFVGDLIHLLPGDNTITYEDSESGRTVEIEIIREDRHA